MFKNILTIPDAFYSQDGKRLSFLAYLFLLMLCVGFFTPGIITMPPTDRDESSFAQASKQMIETDNYTDIRFQETTRYKKPIGIYWLQTTAVRLLNPHHLNEIWAYRIPSLLGAIIAVLVTAALGSLLFTPLTGLCAAIMLASCVLLNVEARLAKTDAALLASVLIAMYSLARAYLGQVENWRIPFAFWSAIACGILLKGPIILLPLFSVFLWMKVSDKNISWFKSLHPILGILYTLLLTVPWFATIIAQSHGAFVQQSAGNDMIAKLWQGQNRGIMPPGLHLMALPLVFFPFSLFVVFAMPDAWKARSDKAVKFCLAWIIPTWIVFELSLTKLPHYVLPAYPGIAILAAKFLVDGFPTLTNTTKRIPIILSVGFWLVLGVGYAVAFSLLPVLSDDTWKPLQIIAGILLIVAQGASLLFLPKDRIASVIVLTAGAMVFMSTVFGYNLPSLKHIWMSREIAEAVAPLKPCSNSELVAVGYHEPSLVFLEGTHTIMANNGTEAADELKRDTCRIAAIDAKHDREFLDAFKDTQAPIDIGKIDGLNSGHGSQSELKLYLLSHP